MPPTKKRKRNPCPPLPPPPVTIRDINVRIEQARLPKGLKEIDRQESHFRVHYDVLLSENKCCGRPRIIASSNTEVWELPPILLLRY
jgi:hypothetical protein